MPLFLIRHAQSANNAKPESDRISDPPITDVGEQQAARLASWITELNLNRLITSPFLRTLQTTRAIHEATGLTPEVRTEWHEHGGCYSGYLDGQMRGERGLSRGEIEQQFPGFQVHEQIGREGWWQERDWETVEQARQRARGVVQRTHDEFVDDDQRVAFVTHADFKRFFLEVIHSSWLDVAMNTSVTTINRSPDALQLVEFNQVDHLPAELRTY